MNTDTLILLLRGKLGISVVAIDACGVPRLLAWIPSGEWPSLRGALKILPRKAKNRSPRLKAASTDIRYESFREELLK